MTQNQPDKLDPKLSLLQFINPIAVPSKTCTQMPKKALCLWKCALVNVLTQAVDTLQLLSKLDTTAELENTQIHDPESTE